MVVGVVMKTGGTGMVGTGVVTVEETVDTVEGASRVPQMIGATGTVADLEATGVEGMASGAAGTGMTGVEMEVTVAQASRARPVSARGLGRCSRVDRDPVPFCSGMTRARVNSA